MPQTAVLVVGFARLDSLKRILEKVDTNSRSLYIYIDKAADQYKFENSKVISFVERIAKDSNIRVKVAEKHFGPGASVPNAINWAFESENQLIILEDDCIPGDQAFIYFDENINLIEGINLLLSGTGFDYCEKRELPNGIFQLSYPLISGWATNKEAWNLASTYLYSNPKITQIVSKVLSNPSKLHAVMYFWSAYLARKFHFTRAWDSSVVLYMLLNNKKALVPRETIIENVGLDLVAANTRSEGMTTGIYRKLSGIDIEKRCFDLKNDRLLIRRAEKEIESGIYSFKLRQVFSPAKFLPIYLIGWMHLSKQKSIL
jgi:hypothetical protein